MGKWGLDRNQELVHTIFLNPGTQQKTRMCFPPTEQEQVPREDRGDTCVCPACGPVWRSRSMKT